MTKTRKPLKHAWLAASAFGLLSATGCAAGTSLAAGGMGDAFAQAAGIPQMNAFLPNKATVAATERMDIDGVYMISTIGKAIRIDRGRAYAVDSWLHMLTLKVQPDMVVMRNIQKTGPNTYVGDDLPLMGKADMTVSPEGAIAVTVAGSLGPVQYVLVPTEGSRPAPAPDYDDDIDDMPDDDLADCVNLDIDATSGEIICRD